MFPSMALRDLRGAFFMRSFAVTRKGRVAVLKRVFVAPDPGRLRLRFAARGVLGISLAVALCGLAGHSLVAAITGGLAALLALFTVTDTTVRGQAATTALLPAVGLPVLGLAAALHDVPVARDLVFLAVVGAGVYARRWGPRGHSLGVFAFMTFFAMSRERQQPAPYSRCSCWSELCWGALGEPHVWPRIVG